MTRTPPPTESPTIKPVLLLPVVDEVPLLLEELVVGVELEGVELDGVDELLPL